MTLKVIVKGATPELKTFNELEQGALYRKFTDSRTTVCQKLNAVEWSFISLPNASRLGGPHPMPMFMRRTRSFIPLNATLEIEG